MSALLKTSDNYRLAAGCAFLSTCFAVAGWIAALLMLPCAYAEYAG